MTSSPAVLSRPMTNRILLVCALGASLLACGSRQEPPPRQVVVAQRADYYSGHWRGLARVSSSLPGAPQQMDVTLTITQDNPGQCGTFEYGAIGCSGVWQCMSAFDAPSMELQEQVRFGHERCPNGAQVSLRQTNDPTQLIFSYRNAAIAAEGTVSRTDVRRYGVGAE